MNNLMNKEEREISASRPLTVSPKIEEYRKRISDELYLDHAIKKLATELTHQLTK